MYIVNYESSLSLLTQNQISHWHSTNAVLPDCRDVIFKLTSFVSDWVAADEDQDDVNVWEDNWDDDNVEDDFSKQLR